MPSIYCDCIENAFKDSGHNHLFSLTKNVDAWRIPISSNLQLIDRFDAILSPDEQSRALRYHQKKDCERFKVSRIVLRFLLAKYAGNKPEEIEFIKGQNKKPFVKNIGAEMLRYNVSHSGDLILIAVSDSDIGADIEKIDEDFSYAEILSQNFSKEEIDFIQNGKFPAENFYLLWTRKESLLKATSKGIDNDLPFVPSLNGDHLVDQKIIGSDESWIVSSFNVSENYMGSIAYKRGLEPIRFRDIKEFSFQE